MYNSACPTSAFDPAQFRKAQNFPALVDTKRYPTKIAVRKPSKESFIRTQPEITSWFETQVIELKHEDTLYLVSTELAVELQDEPTFCSKLLVPTVTRQGELFIWPIGLAGHNGRSNSWSKSAVAAAELATEQWVRVGSNLGAGVYETTVASGNFPPPEFPADLSFEKMMALAFEGKCITALDHIVLRRLRGEI